MIFATSFRTGLTLPTCTWVRLLLRAFPASTYSATALKTENNSANPFGRDSEGITVSYSMPLIIYILLGYRPFTPAVPISLLNYKKESGWNRVLYYISNTIHHSLSAKSMYKGIIRIKTLVFTYNSQISFMSLL